jgi:hypothetical protein
MSRRTGGRDPASMFMSSVAEVIGFMWAILAQRPAAA